MEWKDTFNYFAWNSPDGFFSQVHPRIKNRFNNQRIHFYRNNYSGMLQLLSPLFAQTVVFSAALNRPVDQVYNSVHTREQPSITVITYSRDITASFEKVEQFCAQHSGHLIVDKTAALSLTTSRYDRIKVIKKDGHVLVCTNKKITENIEYVRKLFAILPRWFQIKENTQDIFMSLVEEKPDTLYSTLLEYYNSNAAFSEEQIIDLFKNAVTHTIERRKNAIQSEISRDSNTIERFYDELHKLYNRIQRLQEQLHGIEVEDGMQLGKEFIEYINKRSGVDILDVNNNGSIVMHIRSALTFFDPEPVKAYIKNLHSTSTLRKFLVDVFIDTKYQIQIGTSVLFNVTSTDEHPVYADTNIEIPANTIWNPHLYYYNCWGSNRVEILKAIRNQLYIPAFEQLYAATASLNTLDGAVWNKFINSLRDALSTDSYNDALNGSDCKFLKDINTGELLTLKEYKERVEQ